MCGSDGRIELNVSGGQAPLFYKWSNGSTDKNLTDIGGGSYSVTITDNNDYHHTFLMNAYYNSYLSRANYLMNFSKLDESEVLINKAIEIKPNAPDAKQLLQKVNQLRTLSK